MKCKEKRLKRWKKKNKNKKFLRGNECEIYIGGGPPGLPVHHIEEPGHI
jgi:hypothetical protein